MSIEERAEAYVKISRLDLEPGTIKWYRHDGYIAGATEQQSLSEARIKELEEALKQMYDCRDKRTRHMIMYAALNPKTK